MGLTPSREDSIDSRVVSPAMVFSIALEAALSHWAPLRLRDQEEGQGCREAAGGPWPMGAPPPPWALPHPFIQLAGEGMSPTFSIWGLQRRGARAAPLPACDLQVWAADKQPAARNGLLGDMAHRPAGSLHALQGLGAPAWPGSHLVPRCCWEGSPQAQAKKSTKRGAAGKGSEAP